MELEIFIAGKVVKRIKINHFICVDEGCMRKSSFNKEYLYSEYPPDIFKNILLGKTIYDAKNLVYITGGFEQFIENENVNIKYKVTAKSHFFKDKKNAILIKIKDIK